MAGKKPTEKPVNEDVGPALLSATGDGLALIGLLFLILGISAFITDILNVKGSGEFLIGLLLVIVGYLLHMRSRKQMKLRMIQLRQMAPPGMGTPPPNDVDSGAYR